MRRTYRTQRYRRGPVLWWFDFQAFRSITGETVIIQVSARRASFAGRSLALNIVLYRTTTRPVATFLPYGPEIIVLVTGSGGASNSIDKNRSKARCRGPMMPTPYAPGATSSAGALGEIRWKPPAVSRSYSLTSCGSSAPTTPKTRDIRVMLAHWHEEG
jgi:hypothetical protein